LQTNFTPSSLPPSQNISNAKFANYSLAAVTDAGAAGGQVAATSDVDTRCPVVPVTVTDHAGSNYNIATVDKSTHHVFRVTEPSSQQHRMSTSITSSHCSKKCYKLASDSSLTMKSINERSSAVSRMYRSTYHMPQTRESLYHQNRMSTSVSSSDSSKQVHKSASDDSENLINERSSAMPCFDKSTHHMPKTTKPIYHQHRMSTLVSSSDSSKQVHKSASNASVKLAMERSSALSRDISDEKSLGAVKQNASAMCKTNLPEQSVRQCIMSLYETYNMVMSMTSCLNNVESDSDNYNDDHVIILSSSDDDG